MMKKNISLYTLLLLLTCFKNTTNTAYDECLHPEQCELTDIIEIADIIQEPVDYTLEEPKEQTIVPKYRWQKIDIEGEKPSNRYGGGAVYDPVNDRVLYFGGFEYPVVEIPGGPRNDLWELKLSPVPVWRKIEQIGAVPIKRTRPLTLWNSFDNSMIIFGGFWHSPNWKVNANLNDVWILPLTGHNPEWINLIQNDEDGLPSPRVSSAGVFNDINNSIVIFGGFSYGIGEKSDTWEATLSPDSAGWNFISDVEWLIEGRGGMCFGYYKKFKGLLIAGGGKEAPGSDIYKDVWFLPLTDKDKDVWQKVQVTKDRPFAFFGGPCIYDKMFDKLVCYGGGERPEGDIYPHETSDTWLFTLVDINTGYWELADIEGGPPDATNWGRMVYDSKRDRFLYLLGAWHDENGGIHSTNDVWELVRVP